MNGYIYTHICQLMSESAISIGSLSLSLSPSSARTLANWFVCHFVPNRDSGPDQAFVQPDFVSKIIINSTCDVLFDVNL